MIPIQLSLEGIYSYQERQVIDFTRLIEAGLFGIFGSVGSGKSTILEAITFALYGDSDRMHSRDNRNYNMMNLKSDRMYIEFDFYNFEDKKFRIVREFKRNSKQFHVVNLTTTTLYEWKDEQWIPMKESNVESIIGLSAENFKRTIIIPQGKFKEFIELGGTARTSMMKEIFNLHHYDLGDNIKKLLASNEEKLQVLSGKLSTFEEISEEIISEKKKLAEENEVTFDAEAKQHKILSEFFEQLKQLRGQIINLREYKAKLEIEKENKIQIDLADKKLKEFVLIQLQFEALLKVEKQLNDKISIQKNDSSLLKEKQVQLEIKITSNKQEILIIKPFMDQIDQKKEAVSDLKTIQEIIANQAIIEKGKERTETGKKMVADLATKQGVQTKYIEQLEIKELKFSSKIIDSSILAAVEIWFHTQKSIIDKQVKNEANLQDSILKINQIGEEFTNLKFSKSNWKQEISEKSDIIKAKLADLNNQLNQLKVREQIARFAHELHDGEDCPLCGSQEHPNIVEAEDVSADLVRVAGLITIEETSKTRLDQTNSQLVQIQTKEDNWNEKLLAYEIEKKQIVQDLTTHSNAFQWSNFSKDEAEFKKKKSENEEFVLQKKQLEEQLRVKRLELSTSTTELETAKTLLQNIENENLIKTTLIAENKSKIKQLKLEKYQTVSYDSMTDLIDKEERLIAENQKKFQELEIQKNELSIQFATSKANLESIEKQFSELSNEQTKNATELEKRLSAMNFQSKTEVEIVLNQMIDIESERKRIQDFHIQYESLVKVIQELEKITGGKSVSEEDFIAEQTKIAISEQNINELREKLATLKFDLNRIEKEYTEKKELLDQKSTLENRKANIKVMQGLFSGNGFVEYVSGIYLRNLCDLANKRFHRMTKNQLSLEISDTNDFEIIDYLNNGRSRSIKTLSGGQSFQVSLSLALALAENVQSLASSNKNFFFIDEGFGTQDAESVNIVFETLSNLRQENRIVGIISHVEELQERIPVSLTIHNDAERGSLITVD
jgi:exonuclease SbcC